MSRCGACASARHGNLPHPHPATQRLRLTPHALRAQCKEILDMIMENSPMKPKDLMVRRPPTSRHTHTSTCAYARTYSYAHTVCGRPLIPHHRIQEAMGIETDESAGVALPPV
jgi:hypothetical protein